MASEIRIVDNSRLVGEEFAAAAIRALTKAGMVAEGYAKDLCVVDTGNLRNSITNTVEMDERAAYVGTAVEYGTYVEMGTGKYIPGGSPPWVYQDDKGNWHRTSGQPPKPFIKPAVADHESEYRKIIKDTLQGK